METNYFFDCSNDAFFEALDRISDLFAYPLFSREHADKEKNAVHSEF